MKYTYFDKSKIQFYLSDQEGKYFVLDLIETWISNAENKYWTNIFIAIEKEDRQKLKDNIHPFKSSCGQIGFAKLNRDGDDIDKIFIKEEWNVIKQKVLSLKSLYDDSKKEALLFKEELLKELGN